MKCTDNSGNSGYYTEREWARIQQQELIEKKKQHKLIGILVLLVLLTMLMAFSVYYFVLRSHDYTLDIPYNKADTVLGTGNNLFSGNVAEPFTHDLCVTEGDTGLSLVSVGAYSAGLFNLNECKTEYAKDIFTKRSPASITKIMTAYVTLKYGNLDDVVMTTSIVKNIEEGSSVCDIKEGDVLTLRQLLYGLMIASGNDAAMMIAEHVAGSVEQFVALMNEEAHAIGATNTHFMNPHGLTAENHYTTVYDIYLMFQAALEYDIFHDMISRKNYYAEYARYDGSPVAVTWESTNYYFTNHAEAPDEVVVFGGKTGTTQDAGACLALMAKDMYGNPYLSIILHSESKDSLYPEMNALLSLIES